MKVIIKEAYPGELREKSDVLINTVRRAVERSGAFVRDTDCDCGECAEHDDKMSKAVDREQILSAKEDSPYRVIRELKERMRAAAEQTHDVMIKDISRNLTSVSLGKGDLL